MPELSPEHREKLRKLVEKLEMERDELKLKAGLAKLDARDDWQDVEKKLDGLRGRLKVIGEEAKDASGDVGAAFESVAEEVRAAFDRVRKVL